MKLIAITALSLFVLATSCDLGSQTEPTSAPGRSLPGYSAGQQVSGTIRIWGHGGRERRFIEPLVLSWEEGFRRHQPGVRFENHLHGNASAIGGLYTGAADLALLDREAWPTELDGYEQVFGHKPSRVMIATGSLDASHYEPALVTFVHKDNPITRLTLDELAAIFGADHRLGSKPIHTWGDLGLTGMWADKPIHAYGYPLRSPAAYFFEKTAFASAEKWSCDLEEAGGAERGEHGVDAGQLSIDALVKDRYGIALSSLAYKNTAIKPLVIAERNGSEYYPATLETVLKRQYPLTRTASIYFERSSAAPLDPKLREFLNYVISRDGQQAIFHQSGYLPLTVNFAEEARRVLQ